MFRNKQKIYASVANPFSLHFADIESMLGAVIALHLPECFHQVELHLEHAPFLDVCPEGPPELHVADEDLVRLRGDLVGPAQEGKHVEVVAFEQCGDLPMRLLVSTLVCCRVFPHCPERKWLGMRLKLPSRTAYSPSNRYHTFGCGLSKRIRQPGAW